MKKMIALLAICAGASATLADPIVYDNGAWDGTGNLASSQYAPNYPFDSQTADDFWLPRNPGNDFTPTAITDVHWTGGYYNGNPGGAAGFNILFYNDAGGMPTGGPGDPSPTAFAQFFIPLGATNETPTAAPGLFTYDVELPASVVVQKETTYWIAIQQVNDFPPQWGWAQTGGITGFAPRQGFPILNVPYWANVLGADRTFYLTGSKVPTPGALALLGLGGLVAGRRRR